MARNNNSTEAQRRYIESLAKNLTDEQLSQAIRKTGSASDKAHDHQATRNQRIRPVYVAAHMRGPDCAPVEESRPSVHVVKE